MLSINHFCLVAGFIATINCSPAFCQNVLSVRPTRTSLPPCNLDSFVYQAGGHAESIYGDEGVGTKPPLANFTKASRINAGIMDQRDTGLTTGHGSFLPDATGADEFMNAPGEWGQSGARGNTSASNLDGVATLMPDTRGVIGLAGQGQSPSGVAQGLSASGLSFVLQVPSQFMQDLAPLLNVGQAAAGAFSAPLGQSATTSP